jgi:LuxR family maltose regulon positive regulatory protein
MAFETARWQVLKEVSIDGTIGLCCGYSLAGNRGIPGEVRKRARVSMVTPILMTKLYIPPLRPNLVPRRRLLERLNEGLHRKLTVVSAPAGFGKTTLLSEWVQSLEACGSMGVKGAWISLDEGDNDPARFGAYLTAALRFTNAHTARACADPSESGGALLHESHLVHLINQVAELPRGLVLVLDDYHLIVSQRIHDALTFVIDHLPDNLHLVLATRADPPLPLPRLRARDHLIELRQSDLCFTTEEAAAFLNSIMGLDLSPKDIAALEARTEGWIAGLLMASLAMQGQKQQTAGTSREAFIRAFTGSHRFVLDYLTEEVLQRQPDEVQAFLLCTSVLDRMCAPVCDVLLDAWKRGTVESWSGQASSLPPFSPPLSSSTSTKPICSSSPSIKSGAGIAITVSLRTCYASDCCRRSRTSCHRCTASLVHGTSSRG